MYKDIYSDDVFRILAKLKKKHPSQHEALKKKIHQILENPLHQHKELRHDLKGRCRVHLGHFVLVFSFDHQNRTVSFLDYDHHDSIYET